MSDPAGLATGQSVLDRLQDVIRARLAEDSDDSYVASLVRNDPDLLLKKIAEEATEVILSTKHVDNQPVREEVADLLFHVLVLLGRRGITFDEVLEVLAGREGISGLEEKQLRSSAKCR